MSDGTTHNPTVSVVIPTHNRARSLRRTLCALATQTYPTDHFETLVIANGCHADTGETVRALATPFALRLVELSASGVSLARNTGASMARGDLLLFLDDDVEPLAGNIEAHANAHRSAPDIISTGPCLSPPLGPRPNLLEERLGRLSAIDPEWIAGWKGKLDWECLLGGNFSMHKSLFERVGGFDISLPRHEDSEFGYRAQKLGARFIFVRDAAAYHHLHENRSLQQFLRNKRTEGRCDVTFTRRHPEIVNSLAISRATRPRTILGRLARWFAFDHPKIGDLAGKTLILGSHGLALLRMQRRWNRLIDCATDYWYLRGVADELGSHAATAAYLADLKSPRT